MEITEVRVRKVNNNSKLKAFASITIDDCFVVHDLKVIEGKKGLFVAMPSRKTNNGDFKDTAHPIATSARELIQNAVLKEYETTGTEAIREVPGDIPVDEHIPETE